MDSGCDQRNNGISKNVYDVIEQLENKKEK